MGDIAVDTDDDIEVEEEAVEQTEKDDDSEEELSDEESSEEAADEEVEIVRQSVDGSQPTVKKQPGFQKRIHKLNAKIEASKEEAAQAATEASVLKQQNELLQLALEQKQSEPVNEVPNPDDFDDGAIDPKYVRALQEYNQNYIDAAIQRQTANIPQQIVEPATDTKLLNRQKTHYDRAAELKVKDYDEVEDTAIDILGKDIVNNLIKSSDTSETILYYLGKNPNEAENIVELSKTDPLGAALQIGQLGAELQMRPKAKAKVAPDPDEDIQGGSSGSGRRGPKGAKFE